MIAVYVSTAIGIPVYMHYCGGELEQVSFVVKSNSCCGGEEEDMDEGCCANENTFARFAPDFTVKKINNGTEIKVPSVDLFFSVLAVTNSELILNECFALDQIFPPPKLLQSKIIQIAVLRI
jgi:hypothetical protein